MAEDPDNPAFGRALGLALPAVSAVGWAEQTDAHGRI